MSQSDSCLRLANLFQAAPVLRFRKGTFLIRPDEPPGGMYWLESGFVKVYTLTVNGQEKQQCLHKSGEVFPLLFALYGVHKPYYYESLTTVVVRKLPTAEFVAAIEQSDQYVQTVNRHLLDHVNVMADRILTLEMSTVYGRVISLLLGFAERFGKTDATGYTVIDLPVTHADLASAICSSRETVSRELELLQRKHLIVLDRHAIGITDLRRLEAELLEAQSDGHQFG